MFISHRLDEVLGLADRVVVLRDGRVVANEPVGQLDHDQMVQLIAGRAVAEVKPNRRTQSPRPALTVTGLRSPQITELSFCAGEGEGVGVSGLFGSGRESLAGVLFGEQHRLGGSVEVLGDELVPGDTRAAIDLAWRTCRPTVVAAAQ